MKKEKRGGSPLAGLTVAAILLASTAGYVSALSRMFQAPLIFEESESDFLDDGSSVAPTAGEDKAAVSIQQSLGRTTAAWLTNALPGYSSGRARELWYLSLDSSGDRRLSIQDSGNYNAYSSVRSAPYSFNQSSNFAPVTAFVSAQRTVPNAPDNTGSTISWSGGGANNSWTTGANWTGGVAPANDLTTDLALFDLASYPRQPTANSVSVAGIRIGDGATATASLTISGSGTGLAIGADGITIFANAGAATLSAVTAIGAAQSWTNNSSNVFTIATGGVTFNNLLTLNGGTFRFNAAGTGAGGVKITSGSSVTNGGTGAIFGIGTLELNSGTYLNSTTGTVRSLANVVSITGNFTFDSAGGINEFSGGASTTGDVTLTINNATTRFVTNPFTLGGNLTTAGNSRLNLQGGLNLGGADRTITAGATGANPGNFIAGAIDSSAAGNKLILAGNNFSIGSGATGVTPGTNIVNFDVNATGTISFAGPNTFLGSVTVEAGTVNVTNDSGLGSSTAATAGLFMTPSSGTATVNFTSATPAIASLSSSGAGTSNVVLGNTSGTPSATALTVGGNNASTTFAGNISDKTGTNAAAIGSLTKTGSGTLILSGTNTYTGTTTVNAGTLLVNGSTASSSAVTVNNSGTLGGTGTVSGTVDVKSGGTLSPGTSPGTLTTGAVTLENGSTFAVDLTAGSGNDVLVTPSVTLGSLVTGPSLSLNITGTLTTGQQFFIVNNTGGSAVSGVFAQGATTTSGGYTFLIDYLADFGTSSAAGGNDIMLEVTAVPEPSTWIGAALALGAIVFTQRRRLRGCYLSVRGS